MSVVRFTEIARPRLIGSKEGTAATGAFWIDDASGAVVRSQLEMHQQRVDATIEVTFASHPTLKLWLPASMDETYSIRIAPSSVVDGKATYSNFRQFRVDTSAVIK